MKCLHCNIEYEKPKESECWESCCQKKFLNKECKDYMVECIYAWNKAHGLYITGDPPGQTVTKKDLWDKYHHKRGDYPLNPGITYKEIE